MQTLSQITSPIAALFIAALACNASEEHLMIDRTGESLLHYAEASPPRSAVATNLPVPWSVAWDADAQAVYWTEIGSGSIFRKFLDDGTVEQVYSSSNSVLRGLVLDNTTDTLYFLDSEAGTLNAFDLSSSNNVPILSDLIRPNDMALDRVNNALYLTDSGKDAVVRYNLSSHTSSMVLSGSNVVDGVWGIDVVPETGFMYLSDHRTNAIMRATLDGSNLTVLVSGQETPRGLCVDRHHERLYWLEASSSNLLSSTLEGFDVQVVLAHAAASPRDLASYEAMDQDGDFLNDDWERFYFGHLREEPYGDADGDQLDNFTELAFGSAPDDAAHLPPGTQLSFSNGVNPILEYYLRTDGWMNYTVMHSPDLQTWSSSLLAKELSFIPDGANGATRIILLDEAASLFGEKNFFKIEARR